MVNLSDNKFYDNAHSDDPLERVQTKWHDCEVASFGQP